MKRNHEADRSIDALLRTSFKADPATSSAPGPCVDPETIAAWTEGRLPASETATVDAHLAACASCQEVLAVFARTEAKPVDPVVSGFGWIRWRWAVPVAVAATAAAVWVAVPNRDISVDEFERTVAPAIETTQAPANVPSAADAVTPSPNPPPAVVPPGAPAPLLEDRADNAEKDATKREERRAQDVKKEAAEGFSARQSAAAAAPPPAAQDQARFLSELRSDLLRQAPATEAVGAGLLRWRIVRPGRLERSLDGGTTWQLISLPQEIEVTGVRAADSSAIVTTADGREFRTDDRGTTWDPVLP